MSLGKELTQELHKPDSEERKCMRDLKIIFGQ